MSKGSVFVSNRTQAVRLPADARFPISGTWPMRTELTGNLKKNVNALASSIVLVCRPRPTDAASRREFLTALKRELPAALVHLQRGNIAPVDLAQAAIGPGMAVYTRFSRVLDAEGYALTVREALALINQALDEALEQSAACRPSGYFAIAREVPSGCWPRCAHRDEIPAAGRLGREWPGTLQRSRQASCRSPHAKTSA